jgi:hypothetical protein
MNARLVAAFSALSLALGAACFSGCTIETSPIVPDAGGGETDAGASTEGDADAGTVSELPVGPPVGIRCHDKLCPASEKCCISTGADGGLDHTCSADCSAIGKTIACDGPEDCAGTGARYCCGSYSVSALDTLPTEGPHKFLYCPVRTASAECKTTCATQFDRGCPNTNTVRHCKTKMDCSNNGIYTECCTLPLANHHATFCVDKNTAPYGSCARQ